MSPRRKNADAQAQLQAEVDRELKIVDLEQAIGDREDAIIDRSQAALDRDQEDIDAREDTTPADTVVHRRIQLRVDRSQAALDAYQEALAVVQELRDRRLTLLESEQERLDADGLIEELLTVADLEQRADAAAHRAEIARERASAMAARADAAQRRAEAARRREEAQPTSGAQDSEAGGPSAGG